MSAVNMYVPVDKGGSVSLTVRLQTPAPQRPSAVSSDFAEKSNPMADIKNNY